MAPLTCKRGAPILLVKEIVTELMIAAPVGGVFSYLQLKAVRPSLHLSFRIHGFLSISISTDLSFHKPECQIFVCHAPHTRRVPGTQRPLSRYWTNERISTSVPDHQSPTTLIRKTNATSTSTHPSPTAVTTTPRGLLCAGPCAKSIIYLI